MTENLDTIFAVRWKKTGEDPEFHGISVHRSERAAQVFARSYLDKNPDFRPDIGALEEKKYRIGARKIPITARKGSNLLQVLGSCETAFMAVRGTENPLLTDFHDLTKAFNLNAQESIVPITVPSDFIKRSNARAKMREHHPRTH